MLVILDKMNLDLIKKSIASKIGENVQITVHGLRNKTSTYVGKIYHIYPNIFTIKTDMGEKSFTYNDVIINEVRIKYLQ
jgi:uncharacterized protein Veg